LPFQRSTTDQPKIWNQFRWSLSVLYYAQDYYAYISGLYISSSEPDTTRFGNLSISVHKWRKGGEALLRGVRQKELFISLLSQIFIKAIYIWRTVSFEHNCVRACTPFPRVMMENRFIFKTPCCFCNTIGDVQKTSKPTPKCRMKAIKSVRALMSWYY
jgi:hypothetical protein